MEESCVFPLLPSLPAKESLSPALCNFLNYHFQTPADLDRARELQSQLAAECHSLDLQFHQLQTRIAQKALDAAACFQVAQKSAQDLKNDVGQKRQAIVEKSDCFRFEEDGDPQQSELFKELEALAGEVSRIEHARAYAETTMRLERLVGDLEDATAVASAATPVIPRRRTGAPFLVRSSLDILASAVKSLQGIEGVMTRVSKTGSKWHRLITAVDTRVDSAVASLRPAAIANHRSVIDTVGWPPSLLSTTVSFNKDSRRPNPLLEMNGELKTEYRKSFIALSILQAVQLKRRERQINLLNDINIHLNINGTKHSQREPLWTVEELVSPVASKVAVHFTKWLQKPELVFALAYRLADEYADSIEELLQPMLDEAKVEGYSAREEWVRAIAAMVADHLRARSLPPLLKDFDDDDLVKEATILWLHTVDQTLAFDRKMHALAAKGLGLPQVTLGEVSHVELVLGNQLSCISVFGNRSDWLKIWAKLELKDALEKIRFELEQERAWFPGNPDHFSSALDASATGEKRNYEIHGKHMFPTTGSFRAPAGANSVMSILWAVIDRCRTLPDANQRLTFVKVAGMPIVQAYFEDLVERCRESEALTALTEEDAMAKVAICINAAGYCELTLQEWGEDIFFLELKLADLLAEGEKTSKASSAGVISQSDLQQVEGSIFDNELERYRGFKADWLGKLVSVVSRGFDSRCRDYIRNKKRWLEGSIDNPYLEDGSYEKKTRDSESNESTINDKNISSVVTEVSPSLVDALAVLQSHLNCLGKAFDEVGYSEFWRQLAASLDQLLLFGVALSGLKFSDYGRRQFATDIYALLKIFKPFCLRPASFFPNLTDTVKLLTMPATEGLQILRVLSSADTSNSKPALDFLREHGIRKLNPAFAQKVLNSRVLAQV
ncbi:hypothetical protein O6H91_01G004700 [Diphasiastrum complanatum]|uniref:Uncharacterized protein n=1 Tax=Diphasiastrum complanatum TaxID=34168 RepID=A0ACC2EMP7_DIPCM|nr:hypothetical protein O6H91_01G004700 [Diphasiastrum complanatum]